eukprot:TRINITY_DN10897_c0_g1_i1.p1 TRINITY_DN10897_c0_g1~~TRINITY_DN10897_c0_g1_i1.p1  ORF type:complete len:84 (+),score=17.51 TRINITY_DN10897_c0_g1_i1:504-755(+)
MYRMWMSKKSTMDSSQRLQNQNGDEEFLSSQDAKRELSENRKNTQSNIDKGVIDAVKGEGSLKEYLKARFSLTSGQYPHAMQF